MKDGEKLCEENDKREERTCGIMRWGRWRGGGGGERALLTTSHRSGRVGLATLASPPLSPPLPRSRPPLLLAPASATLAGAKVIDSENLVIAFDCQLKWQL